MAIDAIGPVGLTVPPPPEAELPPVDEEVEYQEPEAQAPLPEDSGTYVDQTV